MLYNLLGILCSHSLCVSKSDRPFGGKKEEEGSLLIILKWHAWRECDVIQTLFTARLGAE